MEAEKIYDLLREDRAQMETRLAKQNDLSEQRLAIQEKAMEERLMHQQEQSEGRTKEILSELLSSLSRLEEDLEQTNVKFDEMQDVIIEKLDKTSRFVKTTVLTFFIALGTISLAVLIAWFLIW